MALDRQSIEKKDFPIGRRGYDPQAVDDHLNQLAEEIEALDQTERRPAESLAASASEQVRAIVDAAETSAAQIRKDADQEAKQIRAEARKEIRAARDEAAAQSAGHVAKVSQSAASMLERIDAMEQEVSTLVESLRTGASRLNADLQLLASNLDEVRDTVSPAAFEAEEPELESSQVEVTEPAEHAEPEVEVAVAAVEVEVEVDEPEPVAVAASGGESDDIEGARLIALNMALNGNAREDIDRYLAENFDLDDRDALLDEVYASVEG